jgi:hypothetical protein
LHQVLPTTTCKHQGSRMIHKPQSLLRNLSMLWKCSKL